MIEEAMVGLKKTSEKCNRVKQEFNFLKIWIIYFLYGNIDKIQYKKALNMENNLKNSE